MRGLGRGQEALAAYDQAVALKPDFAESHFLTGFGHPDGRFRFAPDWAALGPRAAGMPADRIMHEADATRAGAALKALAQAGDVVLVKASRGMKMEQVINMLTGADSASAKIGQGRGR